MGKSTCDNFPDGGGVPQPQAMAGLGEHPGDIGRVVVAHHPPALDALSVEPGDSPAEKVDHRLLLLIRQHLDVSASAPFGATASRVASSTVAAVFSLHVIAYNLISLGNLLMPTMVAAA